MFAPEGLENLGEGELKDRMVEAGFIAFSQEGGGGLAFGVNVGKPLLTGNPVLIAAMPPVRNVLMVEVNAMLGEFFDDEGRGKALGKHLVDEIAEFDGKLGDFAVARRASVKEFRFWGR